LLVRALGLEWWLFLMALEQELARVLVWWLEGWLWGLAMGL
jgi:hypothetical protein